MTMTDTETDRKRNDRGEYVETYPTDEVLRFVAESDFTGTSDVADKLDSSYETAYKKLRNLEDAGRVNSRKVANSRVWFTSDESETETETETETDTDEGSDMPTVEDGLSPDAVTEDVIPDE